jgi:integrase
MARIARDARIETREARTRLKASHEPYWRQIHQGLFIGYRKGPTGGVWWARRLVEGRYHKQRLGRADDYQDANGLDVLSYAQAARKAMELADQAVTAPIERGYTVADACRDYLLWFRAHRKSYRDTERTVNAHILPTLGKRKVEALTTVELRGWHQALAEAPIRRRGNFVKVDPTDTDAQRARKASANRILTVLKAVLNLAYHEGKAPTDEAWDRVRPFRAVEEPKVRYLTAAEAQRLVNACLPDFRDLVLGALLTGCRYGELTRLKVAEYDPDAGTVLVSESKAGKSRHVPLTGEGRALFDRLTAGRRGEVQVFTRADGQPWAKSHQARPILEASRRAGIDPPVSFHILRHSYGSLLAMRGTPLDVIAAALGHADTRMTSRHYAHLLPSYVAQTIRANLPSFGSEPGNVARLRR